MLVWKPGAYCSTCEHFDVGCANPGAVFIYRKVKVMMRTAGDHDGLAQPQRKVPPLSVPQAIVR